MGNGENHVHCLAVYWLSDGIETSLTHKMQSSLPSYLEVKLTAGVDSLCNLSVQLSIVGAHAYEETIGIRRWTQRKLAYFRR